MNLEDRFQKLSARELQVLHLIMIGRSSPSIAKAVGLSPHTVKYHVTNLLRVTGASDRTHLAAMASRCESVAVTDRDLLATAHEPQARVATHG